MTQFTNSQSTNPQSTNPQSTINYHTLKQLAAATPGLHVTDPSG